MRSPSSWSSHWWPWQASPYSRVARLSRIWAPGGPRFCSRSVFSLPCCPTRERTRRCSVPMSWRTSFRACRGANRPRKESHARRSGDCSPISGNTGGKHWPLRRWRWCTELHRCWPMWCLSSSVHTRWPGHSTGSSHPLSSAWWSPF